MKKVILAADQDTDAIDEILSNLKDDFSYICDGIDKLNKIGGNTRKSGMTIAINFQNNLQSIISEIADEISKQGD